MSANDYSSFSIYTVFRVVVPLRVGTASISLGEGELDGTPGMLPERDIPGRGDAWMLDSNWLL